MKLMNNSEGYNHVKHVTFHKSIGGECMILRVVFTEFLSFLIFTQLTIKK